MSNCVIQAKTSGSGKCVVFVAIDPVSGDPSTVTALASPSEVQHLTLTGTPAGGTFTMSFSGQTTGSVATHLGPPLLYFEWPITLPSAGSYDLWVSIGSAGSPYSTSVLYEVFDGASATSLGTATVNQHTPSSNPTPVTDSILAGDGSAVQWYAIGTNWTFAGTSGRVRMSCPGVLSDEGANGMNADHVRIVPHGGGTATYKDTGGATLFGSYNTFHNWNSTSDSKMVGPSPLGYFSDGLGAGPIALVDPALVQSALTGLSNVGSGNLTATGTGSSIAPVVLDFVGTLALAAQPLITASDAAVNITEFTAGGLRPVLHRQIHGTGSIIDYPLDNFFFGSGKTDSNGNAANIPPYMPCVQAAFLQATPAISYQSAGTFDNYVFTGPDDLYTVNVDRTQGDWNNLPNSGIGGSIAGLTGYIQPGQVQNYLWIQTSTGTYATSKSNWRQQALKAGTYRVSYTRPHDAGLSPTTTWKVTNRAGTVLHTEADDQTAAITGTAGAGVTWHAMPDFVVTVPDGSISEDLNVILTNGSTTAPMVADAIKFERISSDDSIALNADDVLTYSAGAGWLTSAGGPAPAASGVAVQNIVGGALYPDPTVGPATMDLGYNIPTTSYFATTIVHANYLAMASVPDRFPVTGDGYPSLANTATVEVEVNSGFNQSQGDGLLISPVTATRKDVFWKGASDVSLRGGTLVGSETTVSGYRKRTYDLARTYQSYGVDLALVVTNSGAGTGGFTYAFDMSDAHVYENSWAVDIAAPPVYRPDVLASKVAGMRTTRWLDPSGAIDGNPVDFTDLCPPASLMNRDNQQPIRSFGGAVTQVANYTGSTVFDRVGEVSGGHLNSTVPLLLTFSGGHNFPAGKSLYSHAINLTGIVNLSDGGTIDLSDGAHFGYGFLHYEDSTHLVYAPGYQRAADATGAVTMTNTLSGAVGSATVAVGLGCRFGLRDYVAWANTVYASGGTLHLNIADSLTDTALSAIGTYLAANLNAGLKVRIEYTNEPWNFTSPPYAILSLRTYQSGLDNVSTNFLPYYCMRSGQVRDLIRAAWVAGGRSSGDLALGLNAQGAVPTMSAAFGQFCHDHDSIGRTAAQCAAASVAFVPIEFGPGTGEIMYATYWSNRPSFTRNFPREAAYYPVQDMLDADQQIDFTEMFATYGGWDVEVKAHRDALAGVAESSTGAKDGPYASIVIGGYEGGPETLLMFDGSGYTRVRSGTRHRQVQRHPRYYGVCLRHLRMLNDGGLAYFNVFNFGSGNSGPQPYNLAAWSAYVGYEAGYVPGNPTQDAIQVNQYSRLDLVASPMGGAVSTFASLSSTPATTYTAPASPASIAPGSSTTATITPNGTFTGTITGTPGGSASTGLSAIVKTFSGTATPQTATWTPTVAGTLTITWTNSGALTDPANDSVTVTTATATTYTAPISPTTITLGSATTATVTPNHSYTGTITGTPSGSASTGLSPATLTFSGSAAPQTASWTPTASGTLTITWTNNGSLTNPANDSVTVNAAALVGGTITGSATSSTTASLSCPDPTGGTPPITARQWYRNLTGSGPVSGDAVTGATGNTLSDTGLTPATTYYYFFQGFDSASNGVSSGPYSITTPGISSTITGVSVSPASATVPGGAGLQFTATVTGTGAFSASVTWTKTGVGSVGAGGLYAAPAATTSVQSSSVIATSDQDGAFAGTATITVPAEAATQAPGGSARRRWFPMHHR